MIGHKLLAFRNPGRGVWVDGASSGLERERDAIRAVMAEVCTLDLHWPCRKTQAVQIVGFEFEISFNQGGLALPLTG
jgi:hypothetical protein